MDETQWRRQNSRRAGESAGRFVGSVEKAKEDLVQAGVTQFGSGWGWLVIDGKIQATKTANGESPLVHKGNAYSGRRHLGNTPVTADYRNRRPVSLKAFVEHLVNWEYVAELYTVAIKSTPQQAAH